MKFVIEEKYTMNARGGSSEQRERSCLQWAGKGNSENLLSFYTISFFLFFSEFSFEGWVPMPFEINNLFSHFLLGRGKINKSADEGNQFKQWAGIWKLCFREVSSTQPLLSNQFVCKWTCTVGLAPNNAGGTVTKLAQDYHYFKEVFGLLQIPLCLLLKTKWNFNRLFP